MRELQPITSRPTPVRTLTATGQIVIHKRAPADYYSGKALAESPQFAPGHDLVEAMRTLSRMFHAAPVGQVLGRRWHTDSPPDGQNEGEE